MGHQDPTQVALQQRDLRAPQHGKNPELKALKASQQEEIQKLAPHLK